MSPGRRWYSAAARGVFSRAWVVPYWVVQLGGDLGGLSRLRYQRTSDLRDPVRGGQHPRHNGDRRPLHRVDARSAGPRREQAQDAASRPDVEHDIAGTYHRLDRTPGRRPRAAPGRLQRPAVCLWPRPGFHQAFLVTVSLSGGIGRGNLRISVR